jgi:hypothetical protein
MKGAFSTLLGLFALVAVFSVVQPLEAAVEVNGKWSGGWTPQGGVRDAVTVEFSQDAAGKVTGRFITPVEMAFTAVTVNTTSGAVTLEAKDAKSGKVYKLDGKIEGTELKGTLKVGDVSGEVRLIKWTYVPR